MKYIYYIVLVVVLVGGGFFGGYKYGQSKAVGGVAANRAGRGNYSGQFGGNGQVSARFGQNGGARGGVARGEVVAIDTTTITLKLNDGGSKILLFSSSTPISRTATGTIADIKAGNQLMASGEQNSDGSITVSNLQLVSSSTLMRN